MSKGYPLRVAPLLLLIYTGIPNFEAGYRAGPGHSPQLHDYESGATKQIELSTLRLEAFVFRLRRQDRVSGRMAKPKNKENSNIASGPVQKRTRSVLSNTTINSTSIIIEDELVGEAIFIEIDEESHPKRVCTPTCKFGYYFLELYSF